MLAYEILELGVTLSEEACVQLEEISRLNNMHPVLAASALVFASAKTLREHEEARGAAVVPKEAPPGEQLQFLANWFRVSKSETFRRLVNFYFTEQLGVDLKIFKDFLYRKMAVSEKGFPGEVWVDF
jgi:hypothetical protein